VGGEVPDLVAERVRVGVAKFVVVAAPQEAGPGSEVGGDSRGDDPSCLDLLRFAVAGRPVRGGRRLGLRLAVQWPWTPDITAAIARLLAIPSG
jgi:hypothetical protein